MTQKEDTRTYVTARHCRQLAVDQPAVHSPSRKRIKQYIIHTTRYTAARPGCPTRVSKSKYLTATDGHHRQTYVQLATVHV